MFRILLQLMWDLTIFHCFKTFIGIQSLMLLHLIPIPIYIYINNYQPKFSCNEKNTCLNYFLLFFHSRLIWSSCCDESVLPPSLVLLFRRKEKTIAIFLTLLLYGHWLQRLKEATSSIDLKSPKPISGSGEKPIYRASVLDDRFFLNSVKQALKD